MKHVAIAHAIVLSFYIASYQHIYSQSQPIALFLGPSDQSVVAALEDLGYYVVQRPSIPGSLSPYDLIVVTDFHEEGGLGTYIASGGGLVYFGSAAGTIDLSANQGWIGATSVGATGSGENATISVNGPLGSSLGIGDQLRLMDSEESGAPFVNVEAGAEIIATYGGGGVFAYDYEHGDGRVYFQADLDAGVGGAQEQGNLDELLKAGITWAAAKDMTITDFLPPGSEVLTGGDAPDDVVDLEFSDLGFQSNDVSVPEDPIESLYVSTGGELVNPTLYFEVDGQEYFVHGQSGTGVQLTFDTPLNLTSARVEVDGSNGGTASVGFVVQRSVPACEIPGGASSSSVSLPSDVANVGSAGSIGSSVDIPSPPAPLSSLVVGFDQEMDGYVLDFQSSGVQYKCPIQGEALQITFDRPTAVSEVTLDNVGPWGIQGLGVQDSSSVYAKFSRFAGTFLPDVFTAAPSLPPSDVQTVEFTGENEFLQISSPSGKVSSLWVSAGAHLTDRYLYFRSGEDWYSLPITGQFNGTLVMFSRSLEIDEQYATAGLNIGSVSVGYNFAIAVQADAGPDLSVQEKRVIVLDGTKSSGPEGTITYSWSQKSGTPVVLRNADTATASFDAPLVSEKGEQLTFQLLVTDAEGNQSIDTVVVAVKNEKATSNGPPEIGVINQANVDEGARVVLVATAFDPDDDALRYTWTQTGGLDARLEGANTDTLSFIAPQVDSNSVLTFEIKVSDGHGHQSTKDAVVVVRDVSKPTVIPTLPLFSAGHDQVVREGTVVTLEGNRISGDATGYEFKWLQVSGPTVNLTQSASMVATFVAPDIDDETLGLTFRLAMFSPGEVLVGSDDVSVTVNDSPATSPPDKPVAIEVENPSAGPTPFEIGEPGFTAIRRIDAEPPSEIHILSIASPGEMASPNPAGPVVGLWLNVTGDASEMTLHFTTAGRNYVMSAAYNEPVAFVFDKDVSIEDISITASSPVERIELGYYYGQVPLSSIPPPEQTAPGLSPDDSLAIQTNPPTEGAIIKFARENQLAAASIAIVVPVGIGVGLKMASSRRKRILSNPARLIFPKEDPIAGEAEKVKPVIEELERMLGRNLDTAVSASDLLDRFGSGKTQH